MWWRHHDDVAKSRFPRLMELASKSIARQGIQVFPPKAFLRNPEVLNSDDVTVKLAKSHWHVCFIGGEQEVLTLPELMVLMKWRHDLQRQVREGNKDLRGDADVRTLMTADNVRGLLKHLLSTHVLQRRSHPGPMKFDEFREHSLSHWNGWLSWLSNHAVVKQGSLLYPNMILFTETPTHFIFETFGAQGSFQPITNVNAISQSSPSVREYLEQFAPSPGKAAFIAGRNLWFRGIMLVRPTDIPALEDRFHLLQMERLAHLHVTANDVDHLFEVTDKSSLYIEDCILVNSRVHLCRMKRVFAMGVVPRRFTSADFLVDMEDKIRTTGPGSGDLPWGVLLSNDEASRLHPLYSQFANLFLIPGLRETTIGKFLLQNPQIIQISLDCDKFLAEAEFEWQEGNPDPTEKAIRPDMLLHRGDDYYDILDLKTCCLDRTSITKGGHKRRRFIDYVMEGAAQLANYREYFRFVRNQQHAWSRYRARVQNPRLYLVVGSYENAPRDEIEEASRSLHPDITLIDYDTLNTLFLTRTVPLKGSQKLPEISK